MGVDLTQAPPAATGTGPGGAPGQPGGLAFSAAAVQNNFGFTALWQPTSPATDTIRAVAIQLDGDGWVQIVTNGSGTFFEVWNQSSVRTVNTQLGASNTFGISDGALKPIPNSTEYILVVAPTVAGTYSILWSGGPTTVLQTSDIAFVKITNAGVVTAVYNVTRPGRTNKSVNSGTWDVNSTAMVFVHAYTSGEEAYLIDMSGAGSTVSIKTSSGSGGRDQPARIGEGSPGALTVGNQACPSGDNVTWTSPSLVGGAGSTGLQTDDIPLSRLWAIGGDPATSGNDTYLWERRNGPAALPTNSRSVTMYRFVARPAVSPETLEMVTTLAGVLPPYVGARLSAQYGSQFSYAYAFTESHEVWPGYSVSLPPGYHGGYAFPVWSYPSGNLVDIYVAYIRVDDYTGTVAQRNTLIKAGMNASNSTNAWHQYDGGSENVRIYLNIGGVGSWTNLRFLLNQDLIVDAPAPDHYFILNNRGTIGASVPWGSGWVLNRITMV
jgi:hypothetical protein